MPICQAPDFGRLFLKTAIFQMRASFSANIRKPYTGMDLSSSDIEGISLTMDHIRGVIVNEQQALRLVQLLGIIVKE